MHLGHFFFYGPQVFKVALAGELTMYTTLHAYFRSASLPRLAGAAGDLGSIEEVRVAAQVQGLRSLGERAEAAPEVALVGVVDVAVDDVGDFVAVDRAPELVRNVAQLRELRAAGGEEQGYLVFAQVSLPGPRERPDELGAHLRGPLPAHLSDCLDRNVFDSSRRPALGSRETLGVHRGPGAGAELLVHPLLGVEGVGGVEGEPFEEQVALRLGRLLQLGEVRPGTLGIYVIRGDGGDATPVVYAGVDVPRIRGHSVCRCTREVRRRLHGHTLRQEEPGERNRSQHLILRRLRRSPHPRSRLGPEVLDDARLEVAVSLVLLPDGEQGIHPLLGRLPDTDEQPRRERYA